MFLTMLLEFVYQQVNAMIIKPALDYLVDHSGLIFPHGILPGTVPTGIRFEFTEIQWEAYIWNPEPADPNASIKPTWIQLTEAENNAIILDLRTNLLEQNDIQATNRIAILYHPKAAVDRNREWEVRFSGINLTVQDSKRIQLTTIHNTNKITITAAVTLIELKGIDVESDIGWTISG